MGMAGTRPTRFARVTNMRQDAPGAATYVAEEACRGWRVIDLARVLIGPPVAWSPGIGSLNCVSPVAVAIGAATPWTIRSSTHFPALPNPTVRIQT